MSPERALHLFMTADAAGGVWSYALDLAAGLAGHGVRTTVAVLGPPPDPGQRDRARAVPGLRLLVTGLPLEWLADDTRAMQAAGRRVAALARDAGADVVHLNGPALAGHGEFAAPVVAVSHSCLATWWAAMEGGPLPADFAWRAALVRQGLLAADLCLAPTRAFAAATARAYALPAAPRAVHNGRSRPACGGAGMAAAPAEAVFTAGRLWDRAKNVATLDRAAALLGLPFEAAGPLEGPEGSRVALRHIRPLGTLSGAAVRERLAARPIFVSVARYEPFGLTALEAAQAGCALVLADIPTFRELWDGAAAFVPPKEPGAIADAVARLAGDPALRRDRGRAAAERAERYALEAMAARMVETYRSVLGRRGGGSLEGGTAA